MGFNLGVLLLLQSRASLIWPAPGLIPDRRGTSTLGIIAIIRTCERTVSPASSKPRVRGWGANVRMPGLGAPRTRPPFAVWQC